MRFRLGLVILMVVAIAICVCLASRAEAVDNCWGCAYNGQFQWFYCYLGAHGPAWDDCLPRPQAAGYCEVQGYHYCP